ncbi:hypothetical protein [Nakamurella leprariae]|uniref:Uncharacterized protein n=1 Tax=Nakamurella leprariae TaxID=2803911 RepID=A0A939C280_9ACTN|nr:hypothetical protein [Nakamurella leprariae]MBM9467934.1 hypothetical protein [Nakamurella leprariae]
MTMGDRIKSTATLQADAGSLLDEQPAAPIDAADTVDTPAGRETALD